MKLIKTQDAVGHVLCHDMTQIIPGAYKDARFRKGHVVTAEDIPVLLSMGKENLYVWEVREGILHENEAAERLCALCINDNMERTAPKEGKIELKAAIDGVFLVDTERLLAVNMQEELMIATRKSGTAVRKGDKLCGTRVIPLVIEEEKLDEAARLAGEAPLMSLRPYTLRRAAVITTGSEVYHGRIEDKFTPVLADKLRAFGIEVTEHTCCDDGTDNITAAIATMREKDVDMIVCTGGMSVDPDDNTPGAIKQSGARIVTYGAPVLPGAMFLLGYFDDGRPIMGLPGCVMYAKATIFDLVLPRIAAGVELTRRDFVVMGEGGLCLQCEVCHYPICPFGK
ncbi:MAG: molybdopterin-binding protein [Oscillospiraceae bacterium]|nr:molybdopterin-binding protein [Oscillospiraceae bacterium]